VRRIVAVIVRQRERRRSRARVISDTEGQRKERRGQERRGGERRDFKWQLNTLINTTND